MQRHIREAHAQNARGSYNLVPVFPLAEGLIREGYAALAELIVAQVHQGVRLIALDGYGGVLWESLRGGLEQEFARHSLTVEWRDTATCFLPKDEIAALIEPNLGGDDPLFGRLFEGALSEFFDLTNLRSLSAVDATTELPVIVYGVGAALAADAELLVYVDVPKDEIQRRIAEKQIVNLGADDASYKRSYFVDWQTLNRHKAAIIPQIDLFVDGCDPARPTFISGDALREGLRQMSETCFRARPWFSPGPWGGHWMKQHFSDLAQDVPNYAWSFELITPENGLVFSSGTHRLECSFDLLMFQQYREVLGVDAERFGYNFPIRFDYLDTFDGGNLSVQVHPREAYIQQQFGEPFTQDETYYITACEPGAEVYLGFVDGVDADAFRREVERSQQEGVQIEVEQYVNRVEAHPHDLFLIPSGTIHCSGVNNLVLEISATPYIYTFKIYDWMRRDLAGNLRPLNIERAWQNLDFQRQESYVEAQLCPKPSILREGEGWREVLVGTHDQLFYTVHRYEFEREVAAETGGHCHILNLVEGQAIRVETANGFQAEFNFAETFVIPAAAGSYRLTALDGQLAKVVVAFVK